MKLGLPPDALDPLSGALTASGRHGPGFHCVPAGPAHPDREADGAGVPESGFRGRGAWPGRLAAPQAGAEPDQAGRARGFTSTEVVYGVTGTGVTELPEYGVSP